MKMILKKLSLASFLKDIDEKQIQHILKLTGSGNPLYLKIVLNELRIHGSFDTLMEQLEKDYGTSPREAFQMILSRLEQEDFGTLIPAEALVKYVLGTIGCSTEGVLVEEFESICKGLIPQCKDMTSEAIMDEVYGLVRHLAPYLIIDGNRINFLYDSFRQAVNMRYDTSYTQFHNILTMIYSKYCYQTGGAQYAVSETSYLTNYIYHAIECSRSWAEAILVDPWFLYSLLSKTSAQKTASYFMRIAEKYNDSAEYEAIANLLMKHSMRLDLGPNTLFYELKRYIGLQNSLVRQLCNKASKVMDLEYYYPVKEELSAGLEADRGMDMYTGGNNLFSKPEPFTWRTICFGCNGIQYEYSAVTNADHPELYLYNMNTCEIQIHSVFPPETPKKEDYSSHEVKLCNEYLMEECSLYRKCRVWHVPSGKLLLETDDNYRSLIACEKDIMWYISITEDNQLRAYRFNKVNDYTVQLEHSYEMKYNEFFRIVQIGVSNDQLYLFFVTGDFWIFDQNFHFIGRQKLPFKLDTYMAGSFSGNQFLYTNRGNMLIMNNPQLLFYNQQMYLKELQNDMIINPVTSAYHLMQFDNQLALMGTGIIHNLNLRTLRYNASQSFPGYSFQSAQKVTIGYNNYIIDLRQDETHFAVLMVRQNDLSVGLRFSAEKPAGARVTDHAFYQDGIVGVMFWNTETHAHMVNPQKENPMIAQYNKLPSKPESVECASYTVAYYDSRDKFKLIHKYLFQKYSYK